MKYEDLKSRCESQEILEKVTSYFEWISALYYVFVFSKICSPLKSKFK